MLTIDGAYGEGGGQVLRTALALSLVTRTPFRIERIRARRAKPGLLRQHLTAVRAAAAVGDAEVTGDALGSPSLTFAPRAVVAGAHAFAIGSAGSAALVLQTVLPALLCADAPASLVIDGGTHNPLAPPYDFLERAYAPLVNRMGPALATRLERPGFFPAGGGRCTATVTPAAALAALDLPSRGVVRAVRARAIVAGLPLEIARRELAVVKARLGWADECLRVESLKPAVGPGNVLVLEVEGEHVTEVFTGFGARGVRAEDVAAAVADEVAAFLASEAPVGPHLADQLVVLAALAGGGSFVTVAPTHHTTTQIETVRRFLGVRVACEPLDARRWVVEVRRG